ncbi:MAG: OmpA family protein [Pseudomonadota bacterium]|nr:OmpA family protein [Pseudomonadota bacterium]
MFTKALKQSMGLAVVMAALAGCSSTSTTDPVTSSTDSSAATSSAADTSSVNSSTDMAQNLDTVFYFDFDQSVLKPEARAALVAHAANLKASPRSVRLEGHADERGTREYNMALGERRAKAVRDFLVLQGVNSSNLETISYGEERLDSSSDHSLNRRVEMK